MTSGIVGILIDIVLLGAMGLLGLAATGGLPGASAQAQDAARDAAARIAPFAGIIGVIGLLWGILKLVLTFDIIGAISIVPVTVLVFIGIMIVLILLGLLLAYPLIARATGGSTGAADAVAKVKSIQRPLSLAAIGLLIAELVIWILATTAHVII